MPSIRESLQQASPKVRWLLGAAAVVAALVLFRALLGGGGDHYAPRNLSRPVTIRCEATGEEWTLPLGMMESQLLARPEGADESVGLPSPANQNRPTGFPVDRELWTESVERVNAERQLSDGKI